MELTFEVHCPDSGVTTQTFKRDAGEMLRIGSFKAHILLTGSAVGRSHAIVECVDHDNITVIDLGQMAGTKINGASISKAKIKLGDVIQIAGCKLILKSTKVGDDERVYTAPELTAAEPDVESDGPKIRYVVIETESNETPFGLDSFKSKAKAVEWIQQKLKKVPKDLLCGAPSYWIREEYYL